MTKNTEKLETTYFNKLVYSQRKRLGEIVTAYCELRGALIDATNIIAALQALGCLDTEAVEKVLGQKDE